MKRQPRLWTKVSGILVLVVSLLAITLSTSTARGAQRLGPQPTPVIFVHGNSGSAQQFESNAMRFSSNGYANNLLYAYEYDTSVSSNDAAINGLDGYIASVKAKTGASKVDVLAHSRGTTVMHAYLNSSAARAANVSHYVNFDGRTSTSPPGGVPTLAIWGEGDQTRTIGGAENVYFPEMSHTEVTTSAQAFSYVYKFLTGSHPATTDVVPQPPGQVRVSGRVAFFPQNSSVAGAHLSVFEVFPGTGQRKTVDPLEQVTIGTDGRFGPFKVNGQQRYEFAVGGLPDGTTQHFYFQPFERSDQFLRLLVSPLGGIGSFVEKGPNHVAIVVSRMREWRGDQTPTLALPDPNDQLAINGQNVLTAANAPRARRVLVAFLFDKGSDGVTDLTASLFPFNVLSFLTAMDVFIPASSNASGTVRVTETMRGPDSEQGIGGQTKTINVANWPSSTGGVTVQFKDYLPNAFSSSGSQG